MDIQVLRGDVWLYDFGYPEGHATIKLRPVIVIQNNLANKHSKTVIITVLRSNPKVGELPVGVKIESKEAGLDHVSYADLGHIYTVDRSRLKNKLGVIMPADMERIARATGVSLGLQ